MPKRRSVPKTRSIPWDCSSKTASHPLADKRRTPRASPPLARTDWAAATPRALEWPLAAGISARRQASVKEGSTDSGGLENVRCSIGGTSPAPIPDMSGPMTRDTRWSSAAGSPMWKSAPRGPATSSAKKVPRLLPEIRRTTSPTKKPWVTAW